MKQVSDIIKTFFEDFERASNTFERDLLAPQFSDPFMAADPNGGIQVVKTDNFLAGIAKRQAFFHSIGFQFVKIVPLDETRLDTHYVMVKVHAQMRFEKTPVLATWHIRSEKAAVRRREYAFTGCRWMCTEDTI